MYLDEVSVYSLLASREGGIATEFTESQTASLNTEVGGSLGVTGANLGSKVGSSQVQASQVLRKATVQTSFKELYDKEREALALKLNDGQGVPEWQSVSDLERESQSATGNTWLVDPLAIRRGDLFEVEVEVEPEPIFRSVAIISTISDLIEGNDTLFSSVDLPGLEMTRAVTQVLDNLLVGLVPVRGRVLSYRAVRLGGREFLVHEKLIAKLSDQEELDIHPVFVVGVAERDSFWKDIRRVVFSEARHTMFCRLTRSGLTDAWRPMKVVDMLAEVAPQLETAIEDFGRGSVLAMREAATSANAPAELTAENYGHVLRQYALLLADYHEGTLESETVEAIVADASPPEDWLATVDALRPPFEQVRQRVDRELGVETPGEVAHDVRQILVAAARAPKSGTVSPTPQGTDTPQDNGTDRFLEAEIVSIYW